MGIKIRDIIGSINKYNFYLYNTKTQRISFLTSNNDSNKKNIAKKIILKNKYNKYNQNYIVVRVKITIVSKKLYELEKKSPLKSLGGPIYGYISEYNIIFSRNGKKAILKKRAPKLKNKVYFPKKYLIKKLKIKNSKWLQKDLKKIALSYSTDKLNTKLLAINTIKNIKV